MTMSNRCICLHGFGENANVYSLFVAQMEKIMPCTAINLMGHGDNRSENYVLSEALRVLDDAISSSTDDEILLVGTSFGGILSYIFSSDNYDQFSSNRHKVKGLIINDVPCCIPAASFTNLTTNLLQLIEEPDLSPDKLNQIYISNGFRRDREPISDEHWLHFISTSARDGRMNYDSNFIQMLLDRDHGVSTLAKEVQFVKLDDIEGTEVLDLRYYWRAIRKPILLFRGERTTFFPSYVRGFMDANPMLTTIVVPDGGHFLDLADPQVMRVITDWTRRNL